MRKKSFLALPCSLLISFSCTFIEFAPPPEQIGYVPIYGPSEDREIAMTDAQAIEDPGKIYIYGEYLLINERFKGIHVFDNSNPEEPVNIGFIRMLGNTDMAIKDGILYGDHLGDLVSITIGDLKEIEETGRLTVQEWTKGIPPPSHAYFECYDPAKGVVVGWREVPVPASNFDCYAY